jgi:hypothetical protein
MKFGIAALVLGSFLAPSAGAFSYLDSIATKGGLSPKNAYSVSKSFNPVAPTTAAGSSYLDGIAEGVMSPSHVKNGISSSIDNSDVILIRSEYNTWLKRYGKTANESRYSTFKANFLTLREYGEQTGNFPLLNEFAECNAEEFAQLKAGSIATTAVSGNASYLSSVSNPVMGSGSPVPKRGYAPGQGSKPMAPASSGIGSSYLSSVAQPRSIAAPQSYAPAAASSAPATAASGSSYLSSVSNPAMGSGSPVPKRGYAPGQGSKPVAPASSGIGSSYLSFVTQPTSTSVDAGTYSAPAASATGASYLSSVSTVTGSGSATPKKSYAPGAGAGKSWGPTSSGIGSSYLSSVAQVGASAVSSTTQSYTQSTPAPVAAAAGASYLSSMSNPSMGSGSPTPKKSYAIGACGAMSSYGNGSSLYLSSVGQPVAAARQRYTPSSAAVPGHASASSGLASGSSYLSSVSSGDGSGSAVPKKSYVPGAGAKPMAPASSGIGSSYLKFVSTNPNPQDIGHKVADGTIVPKLFFAMQAPSQVPRTKKEMSFTKPISRS